MANNEFKSEVDFLVYFLFCNFSSILFYYFPKFVRAYGFLWRMLSLKFDVILCTDLSARLIFLLFLSISGLHPTNAFCFHVKAKQTSFGKQF